MSGKLAGEVILFFVLEQGGLWTWMLDYLLRTVRGRGDNYDVKSRESRRVWVALWVGIELRRCFCFVNMLSDPPLDLKSWAWLLGSVIVRDRGSLPKMLVPVRMPHTLLTGHWLKIPEGRPRECTHARGRKLPENCRLFIRCIYLLLILSVSF